MPLAENKYGKTPMLKVDHANRLSMFHLAAQHGWMDIVIDLITKYKCDTNCKSEFKFNTVYILNYWGGTAVPPYVGMARKKNVGYHGSISVQMPIFHPVVNSTRLKTLRSAVWRCPKLYITLRVFKSVA